MNYETVIIIFTSSAGGEFLLASSSEFLWGQITYKYLVLKRDLIEDPLLTRFIAIF